MEVLEIGNRKIAIKGIGRLYYEEGFPLSMSMDILRGKGIELSWIHVADELYKNGWTESRCIKTLRMEIDDDNIYKEVEKFIKMAKGTTEHFYTGDGYEQQREMIFQYLWGAPSEKALKDGKLRQEIFKNLTKK